MDTDGLLSREKPDILQCIPCGIVIVNDMNYTSEFVSML